MVKRIEIAAENYCIRNNLALRLIDYTAVRCNDVTGAAIARAYRAAPIIESASLPAYKALREETWRQFEQLTKYIEVKVEPEDPYRHVTELLAELCEGHLRVWATAAGNNPHPVLSNDDNDAFRAVHDGFGHGATERGFDKHGEEAAGVKHSQMYSPLARQAMTTETRGQTCMFWYGNDGRFFSIQKAVLLPRDFWASRNR